jgi:uncharacterized protein DUF5818
MKTKYLLVAVGALAISVLSWARPATQPVAHPQDEQAQAQTLTGVVSDSNCGAKHSEASDDAAACVKKCVTGGAKYVLVSGGKVYQLDAQDKFADWAGKSVKVTGTVKDDTITVSDVAAADSDNDSN